MRTSKGKVHSSFRQNWEGTWNDLIADPGDTKSKHCWWQGKNAYKELVASGCIPAVLPGNGTPMIRFLLQHLRFQDVLFLMRWPKTRLTGLGLTLSGRHAPYFLEKRSRRAR